MHRLWAGTTLWLAGALLAVIPPLANSADPPLRAGFANADITPKVTSEKPVWLAGYGFNRQATGVHDPILVRAAVLASGEKRVALVGVDLVGLQLPDVERVRRELPEFAHLLVGSSHNHEGPDVIGIWGRNPFHRGVDDDYVSLVVKQIVAAVRAAEAKLQPVTARFGTAEDETLVNDSRQPIAKDAVLRVLKLESGGKPAGLIVQWNSHPEAMGSRNTLLTADFPWATVGKLERELGCPVVYLSGAVGGLLAPPGELKTPEGRLLREGSFEFTEAYGLRVADLALAAVKHAQPIQLTPFRVATKRVAAPIDNPIYRAARAFGVLRREAWEWKGDSAAPGPPLGPKSPAGPVCLQTEVGCLALGELSLALIPGELYPELVYGKFQEPVDPAADFPDAPREPFVAQMFGSRKWMLVGLASDEIGYLIPRSQWDEKPPFAYGRKESQYGEINSCGPQTAPIVMQALQACVRELSASEQK